MTLDGVELDARAKAGLGRILTVAADAQARAVPSRRVARDVLAADILDAFNATHVIRSGRWCRRSHARLHGGATILISRMEDL